MSSQFTDLSFSAIDDRLFDLDAGFPPFPDTVSENGGDRAIALFAQFQRVVAIEFTLSEMFEESFDERLGYHPVSLEYDESFDGEPQCDQRGSDERHQEDPAHPSECFHDADRVGWHPECIRGRGCGGISG